MSVARDYLNYVESLNNNGKSEHLDMKTLIEGEADGVILVNHENNLEMMNSKASLYFNKMGFNDIIGASFQMLERYVGLKIVRRKICPLGKLIHFDVNLIQQGQDTTKRRLVTEDSSLMEIISMSKKIAPTGASVLITGENGTGKELLARLIHDESDRKDNPFVAVNCAALPETLLESELFGYEKGAFTGAIQKKIGKFEQANQGTILLDEISEIDISLQAKLLRVIQERELDRLGGKQVTNLDIRILATSNVDLRESVRNGSFREDLFYRLNVIHFHIPPLRERKGDVVLLAKYYIEQMNKQYNKNIIDVSPAAYEKLANHLWPGNVRELQNMIERAVLFGRNQILNIEDFLFESPDPLESGNHDVKDLLEPGMTIRGAEQRLIVKTLDQTMGNRTHAAKMLGISLRTLRNKINEYKKEGIEVRAYD